MGSNKATVFIVDDDPAMCNSLSWLIESVGLTVETFQSAREFMRQYNPGCNGCLVLDVRMPEMSGLELQEQLNQLGIDIPIIFITGHGDVPMAVRAIRSGATEFLTKPFNDQVLLDTINRCIKQDSEQREQRVRRERFEKRMKRLTAREYEVMKLVVKGFQNKVIANELGISPKTVELHRAKIMEKMQTKSLAELVAGVISCAPTEVW